MGIADMLINPFKEKKPKRRKLTPEEETQIDELLNDGVSKIEISEELDVEPITITRYIQRREARKVKSISDIMADAEVKMVQEMIRSEDPAFKQALQGAVLQKIVGTPQKSELEKLKEMATTYKEMKAAISGIDPDMDMGDSRGYERSSPVGDLDSFREQLLFYREIAEELNPRGDQSIAHELVRSLREVLPDLVRVIGTQKGAIGQMAAPQVRIEPPMQQYRTPMLAQPQMQESINALPEPEESEAEIDLQTWGIVLQTILPLLDKEPGEAARGVWSAAEYAKLCSNQALYAGLRRLADLSDEDAKAVFLPLVTANPQLLMALRPLVSEQGQVWLHQVQGYLQELFGEQVEDVEEEPVEEAPAPPRKRGRPRKHVEVEE